MHTDADGYCILTKRAQRFRVVLDTWKESIAAPKCQCH